VLKTDGSGIVNLAGPDIGQLLTQDTWGIRWSPDGSQIAYVERILAGRPWSEVFVQDIATRASRMIDMYEGDVDWSPGGRLVYSAGVTNTTLVLMDMKNESKQALRASSGIAAYYSAVQWRPGLNEVAFLGGGGLYLMDAATRTETMQQDGGPITFTIPIGKPSKLVDGNIVSLSWAPDGDRLLYTKHSAPYDLTPWLLDLSDGQATQLAAKRARFGASPWSADGHAILLALQDNSAPPGSPFTPGILAVADQRFHAFSLPHTTYGAPAW
jgi:hypothetical protein